MRNLFLYLGAGLISGLILGFTLKMIQSLSGHRVYRLLLNTDYVPLLNRFVLGELIEFGIHLLISAVLVLILGWIWQRRSIKHPPSAISMAAVTAVVGLVIGILLYPTTLLSAGGTPPIDSLPAWLWWLSAHLLYGAVSGLLLYAILHFQAKRF
ncbi:hypothetical protein B9G55_17390 [Saccharibacillus sp. O16]|nr:hypothetical protein B9G55_17390 [Saccharibacillus sp. O16]